ncbi:hypothetical protein DY123_07145 [Apilactobacillus micheneri]|nr:hypothetical protein DY123_07145 [Apilactobacillus micheneri]
MNIFSLYEIATTLATIFLICILTYNVLMHKISFKQAVFIFIILLISEVLIKLVLKMFFN